MLNSTSVYDKLGEAKAILAFVQHVTLEGNPEDSLTFDSHQITGFYYTLQHAMNLISEVEVLIAPGADDKQASQFATPSPTGRKAGHLHRLGVASN